MLGSCNSHRVNAIAAPTKPRKSAQQERSRQTVDALLEAAARILKKEGPTAFTTNRIAEVAGVGIGSLYQYFPNKLAILRDLQEREQSDTLAVIGQFLADKSLAPPLRLAKAVRFFMESEIEEREMRNAMRDANLFFRIPEIEENAVETAIAAIANFMMHEKGLTHPRSILVARIALGTVRGVTDVIIGAASPDELDECARLVSAMIWRLS